jgi:hypothetical protein
MLRRSGEALQAARLAPGCSPGDMRTALSVLALSSSLLPVPGRLAFWPLRLLLASM